MFTRKRKNRQSSVSDAFAEKAADSYTRLFRAAFYYTGNREDAQDLVQDSISIALKSYGSFKGDSSFYSWLYGIFRNVLRNSLRKKTFISGHGRLVEDRELEQSVSLGTPHTDYVSNEKMEFIRDTVNNLPETYREIVMLRHFEGFSYREIAEILKCREGTVKSRLFKARKILMKKLGEEK